MREYHYIKDFDFTLANLENLTLQDKTKAKVYKYDELKRLPSTGPLLPPDSVYQNIDPREGFALVPDSNDEYPEYGYVQTWETAPKALETILGVGIEAILPEGTKVYLRLITGGLSLYWDGSQWSPATLDTHWNDEEEFDTGFQGGYIPPGKSFGVAIRLESDSERFFTPIVRAVRFICKFFLTYQEEFLYRSLVPYLKSIRPISDYVLKINSDHEISQLNLKSGPYSLKEKNFAPIMGVNRVFIYNGDLSEREDNIKQSYDSDTGLLILSQGVTDNTRLLIEFTYKPTVRVETSSTELYEIPSALPAIVVEGFSETDKQKGGFADTVANKQAGWIKKVSAPVGVSYSFSLSIYTDGGVDLQRLGESIQGLFESDKKIHSPALDEYFPIITGTWETTTTPSLGRLHSGDFGGQILNVPIRYGIETEEVYPVKNVDLTI